MEEVTVNWTSRHLSPKKEGGLGGTLEKTGSLEDPSLI